MDEIPANFEIDEARLNTPSLDLARPFFAEIAERATEFETQGHVSQDLVDRIAETGLYRMCNPVEFGGLGAQPKDFAEVVEYIAQADASSAWVMFIGNMSAFSIADLKGDLGKAIAADRSAFMAGVFAPMGRATRTVRDGVPGFQLNGRWQWGSGSPNCQYLTAGAFIQLEDGSLETLPDGTPRHVSFLIHREELELLDTWHVSGLKGTGSTDFQVENLFLAEERMIATDARRTDQPIFRFPYFGLLAIGIAAVALGIAKSSLNHVIELATAKKPQGSRRSLAQRSAVQINIARVQARLRSARLFVFDTIGNCWDEAQGEGEPSVESRMELRLSLTHAVQTCADIVTDLYTIAGGSSVYSKSPLQRHFRDIHVATQHMMVNEATLELTGRVLLKQEVNTSQL
ncbi:MAG: acyl-CoA dehydrogenase family protein [Pseudomonadota bacterium]